MGHRLLFTFLFLFVGFSILAAVMQGGGGVVSTVLTADIDEDAEFIPATSTASFASADILRIGSEKIVYSSTNATGFFVYSRGYDDTDAQSHDAGRRIYTQEAGIINDAMGYNLAVTVETGGYWGLIMLPINFFIKTVPHLVMLNLNFLATPGLAYIAMFWFAAGVALLVTLAIQIAPIAVSLVSGVTGLIRR